MTIRRRWLLILGCLALTVGAAAVYTWQATSQYSSSAQIFVSTTASDTADAAQGGLFATQRVTSYADLVGTRQLAEQVAEELGGATDPDDLRGKVEAEVVPETVNLRITATDTDPVEARDIAQAYAEALRDLVAEIETPAGRDNAPIKASIVDNAEVNDDPVSPQPVRNIGLAVVLGLLLGVGVAVVRELMDTSVSSSEDVAGVTEAPILGHINTDLVNAGRNPTDALSDSSPWAESFRVLRTNMQYVEADHERRVFVVASSLPTEGKTTIAVNLAVTMAQAGRRVALVECDLRRPLISRRLGLDAAVGTTNVLIGKVDWKDALQDYGDTGLQVLTSGPIPPNPSELLQSQAMGTLIADLRNYFDVVLLDAPPLLPVTDAALLSAQADGMLMVVRHGRTTRDQLGHALERVEAVDARCVGVVVNLAPARKSGREYGYGYGYSYGYGPSAGQPGRGAGEPNPPRRPRRHRQSFEEGGERIKTSTPGDL